MKTSLEMAEEILGPPSAEGWRTKDGHAISESTFSALVRALDRARADGRDIEREHEAGLRHILVSHLDAVQAERAFIVEAIRQVKAAFDEMEGRFAVKLEETRKVVLLEVQASTGARYK